MRGVSEEHIQCDTSSTYDTMHQFTFDMKDLPTPFIAVAVFALLFISDRSDRGSDKELTELRTAIFPAFAQNFAVTIGTPKPFGIAKNHLIP